MNLIEANRERDLFFVNDDRVVFAPKGWCDDFTDPDDDGPSIYCYAGSPVVLDCLTHGEYLNHEVLYWYAVDDLEKMRQVDEAEARKIDPDLFRLLDAIDDGTVK